jgi:hypothetical protein
LNDAGLEITFAGVAHQAGVSRQWLYKNEGLRAEIEKHRANQSNRTRALNQSGSDEVSPITP